LVKILQLRLLIFGIVTLCFGIYGLSNLFYFKSNLIEIKGTLKNVINKTSIVEDRRGYKSNLTELIFSLNEGQQQFHLKDNIGYDETNNEFDRLKLIINRSSKISIWIKKNEIEEFEPTIYEIDIDNKIESNFKSLHSEHFLVHYLLIIIGISSIIGYYWLKFPEKIKKILN
jgi:hypothetical protein